MLPTGSSPCPPPHNPVPQMGIYMCLQAAESPFGNTQVLFGDWWKGGFDGGWEGAMGASVIGGLGEIGQHA